MTENDLLNGAGYMNGDIALAVLITASAILTYARIGFEGTTLRFPFPRMVMAVGFTVWAIRFWHAVWTSIDVIVAPVSMIAIAMVTGGYCAVQLLSIRRAHMLQRYPVHCFLDPDQHCEREDRIEQALRDMR